MNIDYSLYLVTDRRALKDEKLDKVVEKAIIGGATIVQLREKELTSAEFYKIALSVKKITDKYSIPLIINDRLDIALAVDAAGIHIGQDDLPCKVARKILPKGKIIGVSVHNIEEGIKSVNDGADYVGCGAMFNTSTKTDVSNLSIDDLKKIKANINIPVIAIGGINEKNISQFKNTGIDGIAVVSAIMGKEDPKLAAEIIKKEFNNV